MLLNSIGGDILTGA